MRILLHALFFALICSVASAIGGTGLLFTVLLALELTGLISIGWFWVTAPIWILAITGFIIGGLAGALFALGEE